MQSEIILKINLHGYVASCLKFDQQTAFFLFVDRISHASNSINKRQKVCLLIDFIEVLMYDLEKKRGKNESCQIHRTRS